MLEAIIDGIASSEKGLCITDTPIIPVPERDIEHIPIRGRHGSLTKKYAYKDISFSVFFNLLDVDGIKDLIRQIKPWILNCKTLRFSDDADYYYQIKTSSITDIQNTLNLYGYFEVEFTAKPFQIKELNIIELESQGQILYSGTIEGEPNLKIYGAGDVSVSINNRTFHLKSLVDHIEIDSENQRAYKGTESKNDEMIGKYPYLDIGVNAISWIGNVTKIEIDLKEAYL